MAYQAYEIDDTGRKRIVCADDPMLDQYKVYYCSGIGKNGEICNCPVHLVRGSECVAPHFRQATREYDHCKGCTHAENSPFRKIEHLDRSGGDMTAEDLLKVGSRDRTDAPGKYELPSQCCPGSQDQRGEKDDGIGERLSKMVHKNPTSIQQLYLILSLPGNSVYAGSKTVDLLVSSKTIQYHRQHLPMNCGVKLVVAEACFRRDIIPPSPNTILMQDPYYKSAGPNGKNRLYYVIQTNRAQFGLIKNLLKDAKGKRYLILGDWRYDEKTNTYGCVLSKVSHWKLLRSDIDCEDY